MKFQVPLMFPEKDADRVKIINRIVYELPLITMFVVTSGVIRQ